MFSGKMDSVKSSGATGRKGKLSRAFAKVLHLQAGLRASPGDGTKKTKSHEKMEKDQTKNFPVFGFEDEDEDEDEELRERLAKEAFLARLFASISAIKAAYAQLQFAQCPYEPEGIHSADEVIVAELKNMSESKHAFLKKQVSETSPEIALISYEIQEQKSLILTYEILSKKLDSQLKLKSSELDFLKEKLAEANRENKLLEKNLISSGHLAMPSNSLLSDLKPSHFTSYFQQAVKSIRTFVKILIHRMESADWDLDAAASSIQPGISFWTPTHKCYAFESYVCREMFDSFNYPNFSPTTKFLPHQENKRHVFFDRFLDLKSVRPADYLAWKRKSHFATFCSKKYLGLMNRKMESLLFGNLEQRQMVDSGDYPDRPFFTAFSEMAKHIWLLHCLAFSFEPEVSIFQVSKGSRFSDLWMESLSDEAFLMSDGTAETDPQVAFSVVPGFRVGKTIIPCQVYLSR